MAEVIWTDPALQQRYGIVQRWHAERITVAMLFDSTSQQVLFVDLFMLEVPNANQIF